MAKFVLLLAFLFYSVIGSAQQNISSSTQQFTFEGTVDLRFRTTKDNPNTSYYILNTSSVIPEINSAYSNIIIPTYLEFNKDDKVTVKGTLTAAKDSTGNIGYRVKISSVKQYKDTSLLKHTVYNQYEQLVKFEEYDKEGNQGMGYYYAEFENNIPTTNTKEFPDFYTGTCNYYFYKDLTHEINYLNGNLHGWYSMLDEDGILCEEGNYVHGKKDGYWTEALEYGNGMGKYKNGVTPGDWTRFNPDTIISYSNGKLPDGVFIPEENKTFVEKEGYKQEEKHGKWTEKGIMDIENWTGKYKNGLREGKWKAETSNETLTYVHGELNGYYEHLNKDNVLLGKGKYKEGVKKGKWTEIAFHASEPSNSFYKTGKYENGKREGIWKDESNSIEMYNEGILLWWKKENEEEKTLAEPMPYSLF